MKEEKAATDLKQRARKLTPLLLIAIGVVVGVTLHAMHFRSPFGTDSTSGLGSSDKPLEFMYLDSGRVRAYLAQLTGGTFATQHIAHKLVKKVNGEIVVEPVKAGASSEEEDFIEREVTPTAASNYVELFHDIKDDLHTIGLRKYQTEVGRGHLQEGDLVTFHTASLRPPVYLNPYLAVRQSATLSALFPIPSSDPERRAVIESWREASLKFTKQVGENPRVVFAIQPLRDSELGNVKYLLPMNVRQLTDERSLLKLGGGDFTVVGKIVRIFPERSGQELSSDGDNYTYVDSPTRESWERPLEEAPGELICRSNPECASAVRSPEGGVHGAARQELIEEARSRLLAAVREQTEIESKGAVILPVAIYK